MEPLRMRLRKEKKRSVAENFAWLVLDFKGEGDLTI
jgi:hypothetical protein